MRGHGILEIPLLFLWRSPPIPGDLDAVGVDDAAGAWSNR
jgi:hypothetical protein